MDRFWSKAQYSPGCWEWKKATNRKGGYGQFYLGGKLRPAHRVAYELMIGPILAGLVVRHKCDNPRCVNPDHLEVGTQADNNRDRDERGRNHNSRKTRCPEGHEYTPENTRWRGTQRHCRTCQRTHERQRYQGLRSKAEG